MKHAQRIQRLETLLANHADSDPCSVWRACWELGHDLPHPLEGQTCREWLALVPTETLRQLLEARP